MKSTRYSNFEFRGKFTSGYDAFNHLASIGLDLLWRDKTARYLQKPLLENHNLSPLILDLACGTADMGLAVQRIIPHALVVGTDPSEDMLIKGLYKKRKTKNNLFLLRAVNDLPFTNNRFDAVTCAFGMRNFINLDNDLREIHRLLKPGGSVYVLDFFVPQNQFINLLLRFYNFLIFPLLGFILTGHIRPYRYLYKSIYKFRSATNFAATLVNTSYKKVKTQKIFFGLAYLIIGTK